eukprot:g1150.t1
MLPDDMACNPRNIYPGSIFNNRNKNLNIYGEDVEVDYRGTDVNVENFYRLLTADVNVENFYRLLTGRHHASIPRSKRLLTDENSNILIYMTGHGGDEFLKFNDMEEISSNDIADSIQQMHKQRRYHRIFFMVDTCQAASLFNQIYSPNVVTIGSSQLGESSYSHHSDRELGISVVDRFTYYALEFFQRGEEGKESDLLTLFKSFRPQQLHSTPEYRADLLKTPLDQIPVADFFGARSSISFHFTPYPLPPYNLSSTFPLTTITSAASPASSFAVTSTTPTDHSHGGCATSATRPGSPPAASSSTRDPTGPTRLSVPGTRTAHNPSDMLSVLSATIVLLGLGSWGLDRCVATLFQ